jgi:flagellar biosynthetic protein FlhB
MNDNQSELDKREPATPYKREQARRKGSVARSPEVVAVAVVAVATLACFALAGRAIKGLAAMQARLLAAPATHLSEVSQAASLMNSVLADALVVLAPLLMLVVCAAVLASLAQTGPVFATEPLKPDFSRLHLAHGFKRLFSLRVLFELGKNLLKLALLSLVLWLALRSLLPALFALLHVDADRHLPLLTGLTGALLAKLLAALLVVAALDLLFVRWEYARRLRMSARELRDEIKHREGDPRVRSRRRELRTQLLARTRSLQQVREADVVVTNPLRYAVAIRYRPGDDAAPCVVAKGTGELARRVRELAARHGVPVVHSPQLARALYRHAGHEHYVPAEWFPLLARILVWLAAARRAREAALPATATAGRVDAA